MPKSAAIPLESRLPSDGERESANSLRRIVASVLEEGDDASLKVCTGDKQIKEVILTPAVGALLLGLLRHVGSGKAVTILPIDVELSTQKAADILNMSRPHLIKLLESGEIGYVKTGRHRRVRAEDVLAFKQKRDADREDALAEMAAIDVENGLI
ncbi:MAG: helix-turn-helix domain-containing protein [Pseudomonadota bacterium]